MNIDANEHVDERKQAETLLAGENRLLEMVAKGESLPSILDGICRLVEDVSSGSLCSILLLDPNDNRLWNGAAPSLPASYTRAFDGKVIGPETGPCGRATYFREPVIVCDIATDRLGDGYRDLALAHGLQACWSTPIFSSEHKVLGSFAVLSREPRSPTPQHQKIIGQITHLAAVAIEHKRTEAALRESEERFRRMADNISEVIWFSALDPEKVLYVSPSFERIWGLRVEDLYANPRLWTETIHPEDRERVTTTFSRWIAGEKVNYDDVEYRLVQPTGSVRWIHERGVLHLNEQGKPNLASGISTDVTERKRTEALVAGEKGLLELIARGGGLAPVLDALCRFGEEMSGNVLVSILLVSPDRKSLRHGAAPSLPKSYTEAIDGGLIGPRSGSCGTAAFRGERVIVSDIATDPLWEQYRDLAMQHGLRACWSTPIFSTTREVMGTFALYSREPGNPTPEQVNPIERLTHLAAVALERKRAEEALRRSESRFEGILAIAEDAIISIDSNQRIVLFNQGAEKMFGYAQTEVIGQSLDFLVPQRFASAHRKDIEEFARSPDVARAMGQRREVFGLRKDGNEFPAEASISKLDLGGELIFTVILRDITERKQVAESLRASEKLARGQVEVLKSALDALATQSAPDQLVGHILRTLTEQFGAHSSSVWRRDEASGMIGFEFAFEDGRIVKKNDSRFAGIDLWLPMEDFWPWPEVFRTGEPSVIEDIRTVRPFPLRDRLLDLGIVTVLLVPMSVVGRLEGAIGLRFTQKRTFRSEEMELAQALANQAMLAMQLTRLSAESREAAVVAERNRMARDIHDTLAQGFTGVIMQLEAAKGAMAQNDLAEAADRVERAGDLARVGLGEARRSVLALRPRSLQDKSLCVALDDLLKRMTNGSGLQAEFHLDGDEPAMPAEWEEGLLRIAQESLTNTIKHAKAKNFRATLSIGETETQFRLVDDGSGFDLHAEHEGFGLLGMKERVDQMGGQFILRSMPGQGTEIQVILNR